MLHVVPDGTLSAPDAFHDNFPRLAECLDMSLIVLLLNQGRAQWRVIKTFKWGCQLSQGLKSLSHDDLSERLNSSLMMTLDLYLTHYTHVLVKRWFQADYYADVHMYATGCTPLGSISHQRFFFFLPKNKCPGRRALESCKLIVC